MSACITPPPLPPPPATVEYHPPVLAGLPRVELVEPMPNLAPPPVLTLAPTVPPCR